MFTKRGLIRDFIIKLGLFIYIYFYIPVLNCDVLPTQILIR